MTVIDLAEYRAERETSTHYLIFHDGPVPPDFGAIAGCACGFEAHPDDFGWGNSVAQHLINVGREG